VARSLAVYRYGGPVADAIVGAKAGGLTSVWAPLGRRLADRLARAAVAAGAVVPLPTDPHRRRQRGADHTRVLAAEVAARLALPLVPALTVEPGRLDQGERPLDQRGHVDPGAFRPRGRMAPVAVLLIDDVLTTGGTAQAAAIALRRAGAATVTVGVVARAGRHRLGSGPVAPDDERPTAS
jgi:predicted amidophosphoribosyltransferase